MWNPYSGINDPNALDFEDVQPAEDANQLLTGRQNNVDFDYSAYRQGRGHFSDSNDRSSGGSLDVDKSSSNPTISSAGLPPSPSPPRSISPFPSDDSRSTYDPVSHDEDEDHSPAEPRQRPTNSLRHAKGRDRIPEREVPDPFIERYAEEYGDSASSSRSPQKRPWTLDRLLKWNTGEITGIHHPIVDYGDNPEIRAADGFESSSDARTGVPEKTKPRRAQ